MQPIKSALAALRRFITISAAGVLFAGPVAATASAATTLGVNSGPVYLTGNYLYLPIDTNGVFMSSTTGAKFNASGNGGASGVDFWFPGAPVYNFMVGVGGNIYVNGSFPVTSGFASLTVSNASSADSQRAVIKGVVTPGLNFTRDISFATNSRVIQIVDTLQNTGSLVLDNVITLDTADPDQDSSVSPSTLNDVVSVNLANDLVIATGASTGLSVGFGSDSGFQIPSATGFNNISGYSFLDVVDPEGAFTDVDINLAQNYGTLTPGESRTATWSIIFGASKAEVMSALIATNQPPVITAQPVNLLARASNNVAFSVTAISSSTQSYFWLRNGEAIAGATNSNYTTNNVQLSDTGDQFSCLVSNAYGTVLSSNATLTVVAGVGMEFQISSLLTNNSRTIDHDALTGDDRGGIAVSATQVFVTGDNSTARFNATDLTGGLSVGILVDGFCSDLQTETVYALGNGSTRLTALGGGTVTTLIQLNQVTGQPTGATLPLSQSFTMTGGSGIFSGYGRVVVHNGSHVYDILLPSGVVTDLGAMPRPDWFGSESWSVWGVAEYFGGTLYLTYRENGSQRIVRSSVPDGAVSPVATFSNLSDMASFTVSPSRNRWYFHHEGSSQFGGSYETLGYADAQFTFVSTNPPTILNEPASRTIGIGGTATFSVSVAGASPMSYSWLRDGEFITGATTSTYSTNNVQLSDSGSQFSCLVSNQFGTALSSNAVMTVVNLPTDWFTETFDGSALTNALAYHTLTFTPNGTPNFYAACVDTTASFPTDPAGGTNLALGRYGVLRLTLSNNISIYGQTTNVISLRGDGEISLGQGDGAGAGTLASHFSEPRVSAFFFYIYPTEYGGTVSMLQLSNRVAITFSKAFSFYSYTTNSFQMELFYDGRIRLTFLEMGRAPGLVGLSAGQGVPTSYAASDLTGYGSCGPQAPVVVIQPLSQTFFTTRSASFSVGAFGSLPMSYSWLRNGEYIAGATDSIYTTNNVRLSDSGSQFSCLVSNAYGNALSSNATLTVVDAPTDWFTEYFDWYRRTNDLAYHSLTFTPDGSANFYSACAQQTVVFPTDPTGGTNLALGAHTYMQLTLSSNISIYGQATNVIFLASEGHLTLGSGDSSGSVTFANHFSKPRVAASFAHIHPTEYGGKVSMLQLSNRVAITFSKVVNYDYGTTNSFQIELFYDGRIRLTFLEMGNATTLVGVSAGQGVPPSFVASDLTSYAACAPQPPFFVVEPVSQTIPVSRSATFSAGAFGSQPMSYSWLRDGEFIAGATNSIYHANNVPLSDSGAQFSCVVSNEFGTALSSNAVMTVVNVASDWFTESFDGYRSINDLAYHTLTFTPDGSVNFYAACEDTTAGFPTDPTGGTSLALRRYNYVQLALSNNVSIYGQATNVIFLSGDGKLTFGSGDSYGGLTLANHFSTPRVCASFPYLYPTEYGGNVSMLQLSNRVAITFSNASDYYAYRPNSFQMELFYDGRIRLTFLAMGTTTGLVGLSAGQGIPSFFEASNLSSYTSCGPQPPVIGLQPVDQTVSVGSTATFSIGVFGSSPMSYFWLRNGGYIAGATNSAYSMDNVQLSDSGTTFSCLASNAFGTALSSNATMTVAIFPPVFDNAFYDQYVNEGDDFTFVASVSSETPLSFQWLRNGIKIPSATAEALTLVNISMAEAGYYSVVASNLGGATTSDPFYLYVSQTAPTITVMPESIEAFPGGYTTLRVEARGSRPLTFQWQKNSYNLTGQNNATLRLANRKKNEGTYRVVVSNPLGVIASDNISFTIVTQPDWPASFAGTYKGLFYDPNGFWNGETYVPSITHSNSGSFSMQAMRNGLFSGHLQLDGDRIPFAGRFDTSGTATVRASRAAFGKDRLTLSLALGSDYSISGTITSDRWMRDISSDFAPVLQGYRSVFSSANPCLAQGKYTMNLDSVIDVPGFGYCCIRIDALGNLVMSGNTADGGRIVQSVPVSTGGMWPLYVPMYPGPSRTGVGHSYKGSILGWINIDPNNDPIVSGAVFCRKLPNSKQAVYPGGFDFPTTVFGSSYVPSGMSAFVYTLGQGTATFSQGGLEADLNQSAAVVNDRLVIFGLQSTSEIDAATGRIFGNFVTPDGARTNQFKGVINQQYNTIYGQFVGTNSSGVFTVAPNYPY